MRARLLRTAALAVLLGCGAIGHARADGPPPDSVGRGYYGLTAPVVIQADPNSPEQQKRRFGCWATHFGFGCGSFRSDMTFIFGSCRSFYGEACRKEAPSIYPAGPGPTGPSAPGAGAAGARGCGCP